MDEAQEPSRFFIACNEKHCSSKFRFLDWTVHSRVDGPDPRDHFASERNFLSWLRASMTLILIGFMTLMDITVKNFAPSHGLPWSADPVPYKTRIVAFIFIGLGFSSILVALFIYFKNQRQILKRMIKVGQGWAGYTMALLTMFFVCFVMAVALTE